MSLRKHVRLICLNGVTTKADESDHLCCPTPAALASTLAATRTRKLLKWIQRFFSSFILCGREREIRRHHKGFIQRLSTNHSGHELTEGLTAPGEGPTKWTWIRISEIYLSSVIPWRVKDAASVKQTTSDSGCASPRANMVSSDLAIDGDAIRGHHRKRMTCVET